MSPLEGKFFIDPVTGCWLWTATLFADGYARIYYKRKSLKAHRVSYEIFIGPIPEDKQLDHTCHNGSGCHAGKNCLHRRCINPDHLEPTTGQVNTLRGETITGENARKRHCPKGHPYNDVEVWRTKKVRICKTCRSEYRKASHRRWYYSEKGRAWYRKRDHAVVAG